MRQVTLDQLGQMAAAARESLWAQSRAPDGAPRIYLHWSAGRYDTKFGDYHVNITGDGKLWVATENLADRLNHTFYRNSGAVGISLCCAYGANTNNLGDFPPTLAQIEAMAQAIVAVADGLWLTIAPTDNPKKYVMTHGEAADNEDGWYAHEPYGPKNGCERWTWSTWAQMKAPATSFGQPTAAGAAMCYGAKQLGTNGRTDRVKNARKITLYCR